MTKRINSIDVAVSSRIKLARIEAGLSQEQLAKGLGVTFQQLQKYETGTNRCPPGRLVPIAAATGKSIAWFFDAKDSREDGADLVTQMLTTPHGLDVAKSFLAASDNERRVTIARAIAAMAA